MVLTYKLNIDLCNRAAAQLSWQLSTLHSAISLQGARIVNGKSLVGILSANFKKNDTIKILFDYMDDAQKIKDLFNEIGCEINE